MFSRRSSAAEPEPKKGSRAEEDEDTPTKELRSYFAELRAKSGLPGLKKANFLEKSKTFQRYGLYAIALIIFLLVGAATYARVRTDNIRSKKRERKRLKGEWCDDGEINLKRCTTLDLTLKAEPLGDDGIKDLVKRLHGKQFVRKEKRRLRNLIIQHHGISNEGARRLAQLIASCANPLHQLSSPCAFDTSKRFELDLRANPIGKRGVEQIRAAVERAKSFGFPVIVWVGGHSEVRAAGGPRIKVGAIEVQLGKTSSQTKEEDREYRVPPTFMDRLLPHDAATTLKIRIMIAIVAFCCGLAAQHLQSWDPPFKIVWNEEAHTVKLVRRFLEYLGLKFIEAAPDKVLTSAAISGRDSRDLDVPSGRPSPPPDAKAALRVVFADTDASD